MRSCILYSIASLVLLGGCTQPAKKLVVGSTLATGSTMIGEILAQHIHNKLGMTVEKRFGMQETLMAHQALLSGEVDLYAEDTGTAYYVIFKLPVTKDLDVLNSRVPLEYQNLRIKWVAPLGLMEGYAVVASPEKVSASKLSELNNADQGVTLSSSLEFHERFDGFTVLSSGYRLKLGGPVKIMAPHQVGSQVTQKLSNVAVVNTADPILLSDKIKVLEDDEKRFERYPTAVVVREKTLAEHRQLEAALKQLEGKLPVETLRKLLNQVAAQGKTAAAVAAEFLQQAGVN